MKPQGHDRRIGFGVVRLFVLQKQVFDQRQPSFSLQGEITADNRIQARFGFAIGGVDQRLKQRQILLAAANPQHGQIEPTPTGGHFGVFDPGHQLIVLHLVFQLNYLHIRRFGELIVGIASQQFVGVFQVVLEEQQPRLAILGQLGQFREGTLRPAWKWAKASTIAAPSARSP